MYAILYADISNDPRIPNQHESPLLGVVFNLDKVSYPQHWTLSGRFKVNSDYNIIGILDSHELDTVDAIRILKEACKSKMPVQWDGCLIDKPLTVEEVYPSGNFKLSFGKWVYNTDGSELPNIRIVHKE